MLRRWLVPGLVALAALLLAGRFAAAAYVDYLWFAALGAPERWSVQFENQAILGAASAAVAIAFLFANLYVVRQSVVSLVLPRRLGNIEIGEEVPGRYLTQMAFAASVVAGLLLSYPRRNWMELVAVRYAVPFRERDEFFDYDLSYFVNWLPFETTIFTWCLVLLAVTSALVMLLYALTPSLRWVRGDGFHVTLYVRRHVGVIAGLALLILAWSIRLDMLGTLLEGSGVDGAFNAGDRAMIGARTMLSLTTMLAAFLLTWALWTDQVRLALFCLTFVLIVTLATNTLTPLLMRASTGQSDGAQADALSESALAARQYAGIRAGRTRRAFAVDSIIPGEPRSSFSFPDIAAAAIGTPVWDPEPFELAAQQEAGGLRTGNSGFATSRSGQIIQAVIASDESTGEWSASSWTLVRALSGAAMPDGTPRLLPTANALLPLHKVLISEPAPGFVLTADSGNRIHAPAMQTMLSRLAHAWSRQDFRILFSDLPLPNPRVLIHAGVRERLRRVTPFFEQDSRIHPLYHADTLYWAVQLYSHSAGYPLSHPVRISGKRYSYFRHSATALVNAATGEVSILPVEYSDPIARTWIAAIPSLFMSMRSLPGEIAAQLPPAIDGASAQAAAYARYGARNDSISGGLPAATASSDSAEGPLHHSLVHLPAVAPASAWIQPILDGDDRVHRLLIAVGGSSPRTYRLTMQPGPNSWREIISVFETVRDSIAALQDAQIAGGPLRAVPVGDEMMILRTVYSIAPGSAPAIAAVSMLRGDSLHTAPGLLQAGGVPTMADYGDPLTPEQFRAQVDSLYRSMQAAFRRGDLVAFGEAFNAFGILLSRGTR